MTETSSIYDDFKENKSSNMICNSLLFISIVVGITLISKINKVYLDKV
jgi:hypothetical protein